jgi:hypothetical protein
LAAKNGPFTVRISGVDASVSAISDGHTERLDALTTDTPLTWTWTPSSGDWLYLRLRLGSGADEERIWASPWWVD